MAYDLTEEILRLKKARNAIILAHYYDDSTVQDIADYVGDSFYLAQMGKKAQVDVILLAGVVFMAESVKVLSPNAKVLVPDLEAGCSLVDEAPYDQYLEWRSKTPTGIAVTYINSSVEVKAISDVIVTSSNAKKIIESIPAERPVLFGPDKNLGAFLSKELQRPFELWEGSCQVHVLFSAKKLYELIRKEPEAIVIAHPECEPEVLQYADVIGSTSRLLEEVKNNPAKKFIVATEPGIFHQMKKLRPEAQLIQAPEPDGSCGCNHCPYMKLNTLDKIQQALQHLSPEIQIEENLRKKAEISLGRMIDIMDGQTPQWPKSFKESLASVPK